MSETPDINTELAKRGVEFTIGLDTDRVWANGVQVFPANENTLFVFREQGLMPDADGEISWLLKNVTSVVLPTSIAIELRNILNALMPLDGDEAK